MDVFWGVTGIDRSMADENFKIGAPIFDPEFEVTAEAQIFLRDSCDHFRNATVELQTFPDGSDWICLWEVFDDWLVHTRGRGLPLEQDELVVALGVEGSTTGFFSTGFVNIGGVKRKTYIYKEYIGLDMREQKIKWVRLGIDTTLESTMDATKAEKVHLAWKKFLAKLDEVTPASLGKAKMSSFLWVRIMTELSLVRSTITAWAISNVSAFVVILLFTRSMYIALMTTACIFFIVICLLWFMVYVMQWPLGAMEALSVTIFVGMSCDYCLHFAHAFMHSEAPTQQLKVRQALTMVGNSILGAAITTIGSSVCLVFCVIVFFKKMGIIIIVNTVGSLFFALVFFPSMLSIGERGKEVAKKGARVAKKGARAVHQLAVSQSSTSSLDVEEEEGEGIEEVTPLRSGGGAKNAKQVSPLRVEPREGSKSLRLLRDTEETRTSSPSSAGGIELSNIGTEEREEVGGRRIYSYVE